MRIATVAAHFRRDLDVCLERISQIVRDAQAVSADLLVLPHGALGGYHDHLGRVTDGSDLPPALDLHGPEVAAVAAMATGMVVCLGLTEQVEDARANTAVCLAGGDVIGVHRKVHLPEGEREDYVPGDTVDAFDTPLGRIGMLVDYDKTFPEAARSLALDGAVLIVNPCAWPASRTRSTSTVRDRQRLMFDVYDSARAAENQVVLVSANQTGRHGSMRFFGASKVVLPDGSTAAFTGDRAGMVHADVDLDATVAAARRTFHHLQERRPEAYRRLWSS